MSSLSLQDLAVPKFACCGSALHPYRLLECLSGMLVLIESGRETTNPGRLSRLLARVTLQAQSRYSGSTSLVLVIVILPFAVLYFVSGLYFALGLVYYALHRAGDPCGSSCSD